MEEIIQLKDQYYILASSSFSDDRTRVLKHGDTFAVFDRYGDIHPFRFGEQGIYHSGTRYLSRLEMRVNGLRPFLLSSNVLEDNTMLAVDLTNPDMTVRDVFIPRGTLHVFRSKFLWNGICYERLRIWNYGLAHVDAIVTLLFDNDFADIFEVRGNKRSKRGTKRTVVAGDQFVTLGYAGLDGEERQTSIEWYAGDTTSGRVNGSEIIFDLSLEPKSGTIVYLNYCCIPLRRRILRLTYDEALRRADEDRTGIRESDCVIQTSNAHFNNWLTRSYEDVHMMTTRLPEGFYPYAGVPWFSTVFGRDGIITALSYLWVNPVLAKGVLSHLAATQSQANDADKDSEPGKILHESRKGEMAALKEIPFGKYYGSVDVTPLFVVLAGAYFERTGDIDFVKGIWPNVQKAMDWIKRFGDKDHDGFIEYARRTDSGLLNQGWKDSNDAVFHADGSMAQGPIALCEVQGYVYDALKKAAMLANVFGDTNRAASYLQEADTLRRKFEAAFWCEEIGTYALALDGNKKPCKVRTSNAGHCLFSGIASDEHAKRIAHLMMGGDFFSGWGIRTVASTESLYNPMSYHNGSVWPHENAMIASGLARYGFKDFAVNVTSGLFDASLFVDLARLPELFCGFHRRQGEGPTLYPVACAPQAWAAASVFLALQAVLGLTIDGSKRVVRFEQPVLPKAIREVTLSNLLVGSVPVDILIHQHKREVGIDITRGKDQVDVVMVK